MPNKRLSYLFHRYFDKQASAEEQAELMALLHLPENDPDIHQLLQEAWNNLEQDNPVFTHQQSEFMLGNILQAGAEAETGKDIPVYSLQKRSPVIRLKRISAAAAVLVLFSSGIGYWYFQRNQAPKSAPALMAVNSKKVDVPAPHGNNAVLTLSDGSSVVLDSVQNGSFARQGNASVSKSNGNTLVYNSQPDHAASIVYNTISTRRGGLYEVVLPDGSKVCLNTLSSLRFPTAFRKGERVVELTGEAYFNIAKDPHAPFKVHIVTADGVKPMDVQVLGTNFDVMAYSNEEEVRTTLLEGSVRIVQGNKNAVLSPGQQLQLSKQGEFNVDPHADTELALAWKHGSTAFKSADIHSIMRQVERWYDVDVVYEGRIPFRTFTGAIPRDANLSELVRLLEVSKINFKMEGKKLVVMP